MMAGHKKYSLQEVMRMDQYLMSLAAYESSQGMIALPQDVDTATEFHNDVKQQFNVFKRMIQHNECNLEELEQMVLRRHGPIPNPYARMTMSETLEAITLEEPELEYEEEEIPPFLQMLMENLHISLPKDEILIGPDGHIGHVIDVQGEAPQHIGQHVEPEVIETQEDKPAKKPAKKPTTKKPTTKKVKPKTTQTGKKDGRTRPKNRKSSEDN